MRISVLCNAGLALHHNKEVLLVDLPNRNLHPFYPLPDDVWTSIVDGQNPCEIVDGIYFTHCHPDHHDPAPSHR